MSDLFTSAAACSAVAKRTIRAVETSNLAPVATIAKLLNPLMAEFHTRGKLPRSALAEAFRRYLADLEHTENIIDIEVATLRSALLSSNEKRMVRFVLVRSEANALHFVTCETVLTRHEVKVRFSPTQFRVTDHVLQRFMQRERKGLADFFGGVMATIKAASILGPATLYAPGPGVAAPFRGGLLLGEAAFIDEAELQGSNQSIEACYSRHDGGTHAVVSTALLVPGRVPMITMRTFIDEDSLSERKTALRDGLRQWQDTHRVGIDAASSALLFGAATLSDKALLAEMQRNCTAAIYAARDLIMEPTWREFSKKGFD